MEDRSAAPSQPFKDDHTASHDPAAAHTRQLKVASETEAAHDFGSGLATALVGRVSPRPQERGRNCTLLGRKPLREAKAFGLTGRWVAGGPAVSERRALPPRSPDHYLKLRRMGSRRTELGFALLAKA
jgi:hypothetical protein